MFVPMIFFVDDYPLNTQNALISPHTFLNYLKLLADSDTFSATQQQFQSHPKTLLKENEFIFSYDENMSNTIKIIGMKYENQIRFVWKFLGNKRGIKHKRISRKIWDYTIDTQEIVDIFNLFNNDLYNLEQKYRNLVNDRNSEYLSMPIYEDF